MDKINRMKYYTYHIYNFLTVIALTIIIFYEDGEKKEEKEDKEEEKEGRFRITQNTAPFLYILRNSYVVIVQMENWTDIKLMTLVTSGEVRG